jgi:hypothetical protein
MEEKMKKNQKQMVNYSEPRDQEQNLRDLTDLMACMENRIAQITVKLCNIEHHCDNFKELLNNSVHKGPSFGEFSNAKAAITRPPPKNSRSVVDSITGLPSNIIPFPKIGLLYPGNVEKKPEFLPSKRLMASVPIKGMPGRLLPPDIPDYRPFLQRDGLILLAWDKRKTEMGERYTAYWVTSAGTPRFYASKPDTSEDFIFTQPHHKSYAAEDGIEFYGQDAPVYIVHVAPELMMSNSRHKELRQAHIKELQQQGSKVDFNYKYLLTMEKSRNIMDKKSENTHAHRAGA